MVIKLTTKEKIIALKDAIDSIETFKTHSIFSCNVLYMAIMRASAISADYGVYAPYRDPTLKHNFPNWFIEINALLNGESSLDSVNKGLSNEEVNNLRIELLQKELKLIEVGTIDNIWDKAIELSHKETGTILHKTTKLNEEVGELNAAVLLKDGYKFNKHNLSESQINQNIIDEAADTLLVLIDLIDKAGFTKDDLIKSVSKGLGNWENVVISR